MTYTKWDTAPAVDHNSLVPPEVLSVKLTAMYIYLIYLIYLNKDGNDDDHRARKPRACSHGSLITIHTAHELDLKRKSLPHQVCCDVQIRVVPHEMGACYLTAIRHRSIINIMEEVMFLLLQNMLLNICISHVCHVNH